MPFAGNFKAKVLAFREAGGEHSLCFLALGFFLEYLGGRNEVKPQTIIFLRLLKYYSFIIWFFFSLSWLILSPKQYCLRADTALNKREKGITATEPLLFCPQARPESGESSSLKLLMKSGSFLKQMVALYLSLHPPPQAQSFLWLAFFSTSH